MHRRGIDLRCAVPCCAFLASSYGQALAHHVMGLSGLELYEVACHIRQPWLSALGLLRGTVSCGLVQSVSYRLHAFPYHCR